MTYALIYSGSEDLAQVGIVLVTPKGSDAFRLQGLVAPAIRPLAAIERV